MNNEKEELVAKFIQLNETNKICLIAYTAAVYTSQLNTEITIRREYGLDESPKAVEA
jgi:hypothetical protein